MELFEKKVERKILSGFLITVSIKLTNIYRNYSITPITTSHIEIFQFPRLYCVKWDNMIKNSNKQKESDCVTLIQVNIYIYFFEHLNECLG